MNLPNAVALVTGGSGGLGSRICSLLAAENVHIAVGFLHGAERADAVCEAILAQGKKSIAVQIDQTNPESIEAAIKKITEQFGGLDILVNNAAMASGDHTIPLGDLDAFTPEIWDEMMAVNVRGPYLVTRSAHSVFGRSSCARRISELRLPRSHD